MNDKENLTNLLQLIQENPNLPIVPMVDGEIAGDDCGYWLGKWGVARVDKYLVAGERVHFYSDGIYGDKEDLSDWDEIEQVLWHYYDKALVDSCNFGEMVFYYKHLPWKEAIIVYICVP